MNKLIFISIKRYLEHYNKKIFLNMMGNPKTINQKAISCNEKYHKHIIDLVLNNTLFEIACNDLYMIVLFFLSKAECNQVFCHGMNVQNTCINVGAWNASVFYGMQHVVEIILNCIPATLRLSSSLYHTLYA